MFITKAFLENLRELAILFVAEPLFAQVGRPAVRVLAYLELPKSTNLNSYPSKWEH
jgi:hypothetical protein